MAGRRKTGQYQHLNKVGMNGRQIICQPEITGDYANVLIPLGM